MEKKEILMFLMFVSAKRSNSFFFFFQVSSLILHVEEAHTLPVKHFTNPYCNIYLNSVQVAKTHIREGQNPVWSEEFVFE